MGLNMFGISRNSLVQTSDFGLFIPRNYLLPCSSMWGLTSPTSAQGQHGSLSVSTELIHQMDELNDELLWIQHWRSQSLAGGQVIQQRVRFALLPPGILVLLWRRSRGDHWHHLTSATRSRAAQPSSPHFMSPQDRGTPGHPHRSSALLPQQRGAEEGVWWWGKQSLQQDHGGEKPAGGKCFSG